MIEWRIKQQKLGLHEDLTKKKELTNQTGISLD